MTVEQTVTLAALEQAHGKIKRIPDETAAGLLEECPAETRAYQCVNCTTIFTVSPDGDVGVWRPEPLDEQRVD